MKFTKMHGLGNDYLYVYSQTEPTDAPSLSVRLSDRHFGAGSDGMIWILPSKVADCKMRIFNADGSEAKMCGNGIRCVGKYVYDKGIIGKTHLTVETLSGIKTLDLSVEDGKVKKVTVDMGKSVVSEPMTLTVKGENVRLIPVSMGNPHAVIFVDDAEKAEVAEVGSAIEHDAAFPDGVNVEFVSVMDRNNLRMRVWERGSGITMACGTGACAAVSAAVKVGFCGADENVRVHLDGGTLAISVAQDSQVTMTGGAEMIYEGETVE